MELGDIELHPEVRAWLESLSDEQYGHVREYVRLLAEHGPTLGEPYTRQLRGKLRELRFHMERGQWRITYWIMPGLRIALLTVFRKQRQRERAEIERAWRAMQQCIAEGHTAEEDGTMPHEHTSWTELDAVRMASPTAQAAAARTRRAIMIGEQIRRLRRERGLSQAELARKAHTSQAAIARLELGDVDSKISTLDRVCEALGADLLIALQDPATASAQRVGAVADSSPRPAYSTTVAAKRSRPRSGSRK